MNQQRGSRNKATSIANCNHRREKEGDAKKQPQNIEGKEERRGTKNKAPS